MTDLHVDDFSKDAGRALLALYQTFPKPHTLFVEDLCGPDCPDEFGMPSARHLACFSGLLWLADEGFLRYADVIRQQAVDQAVLTGRCLTLLTSHPPGNGGEPPAARHVTLARALESRSSSRVRAAFLELLDAMHG